MKYIFKPGDRLRIKHEGEIYNIKVVADSPSKTARNTCFTCFFAKFAPSDCDTQVCTQVGNRYHFELDNPALDNPTDNKTL